MQYSRRGGKYLDPKADLTFKLVFGDHPDLTMSLLNSLLPLGADEQIAEVEIIANEMVPENPGKKYSVVDVRCRDERGRQFIVEMQLFWNPYFQQRVILNASKAVVKQLNSGESYSLIQPVYCLSLVNDVGFKSAPDEFYHDYAIVNTEHPDRRIEGLRFVFVELPKFQPKTMVEKKMAVLWLRFLTEVGYDNDDVPAELLENELTSKALSIVEKSAMTEQQLEAYDKFWMSVFDEEAISEGRYLEGRAEGRAEGEAIGMAKGQEIGRENEKKETARKMKTKGFTDEDIADVTGLTIEEIRKI